MTFTALGDNNACIWGSKIDMDDTEMVLNLVAEAVDDAVPSTTKESMELPSEILGAVISWTSSDPDSLSETGEVTQSDENVKVELTAEITYNGETMTEIYKVTVRSAS